MIKEYLKAIPFERDEYNATDRYQIQKLSANNYALLEHRNNKIIIKYEFNTKPVTINSFKSAIKIGNGFNHPFYTMFLYSKLTDKNEISMIINRRLIRSTRNGNIIEKINFDNPASQILNQYFLIPKQFLKKLEYSKFRNPEIGSILNNSTCDKMLQGKRRRI